MQGNPALSKTLRSWQKLQGHHELPTCLRQTGTSSSVSSDKFWVTKNINGSCIAGVRPANESRPSPRFSIADFMTSDDLLALIGGYPPRKLEVSPVRRFLVLIGPIMRHHAVHPRINPIHPRIGYGKTQKNWDWCFLQR